MGTWTVLRLVFNRSTPVRQFITHILKNRPRAHLSPHTKDRPNQSHQTLQVEVDSSSHKYNYITPCWEQQKRAIDVVPRSENNSGKIPGTNALIFPISKFITLTSSHQPTFVRDQQ